MKTFKQFMNEDSVVRPSPLYSKRNPDENIVAAAIQDTQTGNIYTGDTHDDAYKTMIDEERFKMNKDRFYSTRLTDFYKNRFAEGFYTDKNRFISRSEALVFMQQHKRPIAKKDLDVRGLPHSFVVQDYLQK